MLPEKFRNVPFSHWMSDTFEACLIMDTFISNVLNADVVTDCLDIFFSLCRCTMSCGNGLTFAIEQQCLHSSEVLPVRYKGSWARPLVGRHKLWNRLEVTQRCDIIIIINVPIPTIICEILPHMWICKLNTGTTSRELNKILWCKNYHTSLLRDMTA